jgi:hypothetical protein
MDQTQGHSAAGRIMSMKHANDTIGNRTRDLPACSAVPQPTAPARTPTWHTKQQKKVKTTFGTGGYTDIRVANFLESYRSDSQGLEPCRWPLNPFSTEVKTTGATYVLYSMSSYHVKSGHLSLPFHQRKEINRVLAPEEFCDLERRGKL